MWLVKSKKDLVSVKFKGAFVITLSRTPPFAVSLTEPFWHSHTAPQRVKDQGKHWTGLFNHLWGRSPHLHENVFLLDLLSGKEPTSNPTCAASNHWFTSSRSWRIIMGHSPRVTTCNLQSDWVLPLNDIGDELLCFFCPYFLFWLPDMVQPSAVMIYSKYLNCRVFAHQFSHTHVYQTQSQRLAIHLNQAGCWSHVEKELSLESTVVNLLWVVILLLHYKEPWECLSGPKE